VKYIWGAMTSLLTMGGATIPEMMQNISNTFDVSWHIKFMFQKYDKIFSYDILSSSFLFGGSQKQKLGVLEFEPSQTESESPWFLLPSLEM
jgi:hypothetical protein